MELFYRVAFFLLFLVPYISGSSDVPAKPTIDPPMTGLSVYTNEEQASSNSSKNGTTYCNLNISSTVMALINYGFDGYWVYVSMYHGRPAYRSANRVYYLYYEASATSWKIADGLGDAKKKIIWALVSDLATSPEKIKATWWVNGQPDKSVKVKCTVATCKLPVAISAKYGYDITKCNTAKKALTASACKLKCNTKRYYFGSPKVTCPNFGQFIVQGSCSLPKCTLPSINFTGYDLTYCAAKKTAVLGSQCLLLCRTKDGYEGSPRVTCAKNGGKFVIKGGCAVPRCKLPSAISALNGYETRRCNAAKIAIPASQCKLSCLARQHFFGTPRVSCPASGKFVLTGSCEHYCNLNFTSDRFRSYQMGLDGQYSFVSMYQNHPAYQSANERYYMYFEPSRTGWRISDALGDSNPAYKINWAMVADMAASPELITATWYTNGVPEKTARAKCVADD